MAFCPSPLPGLRPASRRLPLWLLAAAAAGLVLLALVHLAPPPAAAARLDASTADFDPDSAAHRAFCASLAGRADFGAALAAAEHVEAQSAASDGTPPPLARAVAAADLLAGNVELPEVDSAAGIPLIIHQSWKDPSPPALYDDLILSWRRTYPSAVYVLWSDSDNQALVDARYPDLKRVYASFAAEIYKADFIRNLYMHAFGGLYADLDSEALRPLTPLFDRLASAAFASSFSSSSSSSSSSSPSSSSSGAADERGPLAFLGSMRTAAYPSHAVPNAFMASAPAHPFWLAGPVARAARALADGRARDPEHLTGPVALKESWDDWVAAAAGERAAGVVELLEESVIYPYSWDARTEVQECVCWAKSPAFSASRCKLLFPGSYAVNYWKHSW